MTSSDTGNVEDHPMSTANTHIWHRKEYRNMAMMIYYCNVIQSMKQVALPLTGVSKDLLAVKNIAADLIHDSV
jgi:hypothetical protein